MSDRRRLSSGGRWEHDAAYSRAVVHGPWVFVSGTTYTDADTAAGQADGIFSIIDETLTKAGLSMADVVRVRYLLPDAADFEECWPVIRQWLGSVRPAATMQVCGLLDPAMKIEIEVTALRDGESVPD